MSYTERIVFRFFPLRETRDTAEYTVAVEIITATGEDLVAIGLMTYIPHQLIVGGIENMMKRNRQLHYTEARTKVTSVNGNIVDDVLPQFLAQLHQLDSVQSLHVGRGIDFGQEWTGFDFHFSAKYQNTLISVDCFKNYQIKRSEPPCRQAFLVISPA